MRIDVAHLLRLHFRVIQRVHHDAKSSITVLCRLSNVVSISAHPVAHNLRQNFPSTAAGKFQFFQYQNPRAFSDDKPIPPGIPRTAGFLRRIISRGKCPHGCESAHSHRSNGRFCPARNHGVGVASRNDLVGISHRVSAGCASRTGGLVRTLRVVPDADMSGRQVHDCRGNKKRRNLARASVQQVGMLPLDDIESSDA